MNPPRKNPYKKKSPAKGVWEEQEGLARSPEKAASSSFLREGAKIPKSPVERQRRAPKRAVGTIGRRPCRTSDPKGSYRIKTRRDLSKKKMRKRRDRKDPIGEKTCVLLKKKRNQLLSRGRGSGVWRKGGRENNQESPSLKISSHDAPAKKENRSGGGGGAYAFHEKSRGNRLKVILRKRASGWLEGGINGPSGRKEPGM